MKAVPIMLKGDGLDLFGKNEDRCKSFEEALALLRTYYHGDRQRECVLFECKQH